MAVVAASLGIDPTGYLTTRDVTLRRTLAHIYLQAAERQEQQRRRTAGDIATALGGRLRWE